MRAVQYRLVNVRGEAPASWLPCPPSRVDAVRELLSGNQPEALSLTLKWEDGSEVEYRLEPRQLISEFDADAEFEEIEDEWLDQMGIPK